YIDGNEVYRNLEKDVDQENSKETISVDYFWQQDDIYYTLTIFNTDGYHVYFEQYILCSYYYDKYY
ncbi:MAG: Peptidase M56, BlaR1, partial [Clostridium butyricum DORA_1]